MRVKQSAPQACFSRESLIDIRISRCQNRRKTRTGTTFRLCVCPGGLRDERLQGGDPAGFRFEIRLDSARLLACRHDQRRVWAGDSYCVIFMD
jgi:hypothetical protein